MMNRLRYYYLILLCCLPLTALAEHFEGVVRDAHSRVPLPKVEILSHQGKVLTQTDSIGRFELEQEAEQLEIIVFLQGYAQKKVVIKTGGVHDISLSPLGKSLSTLTVTAVRERRGNNAFTYSTNEVKGIATLTGETDVMRYMQVLPGVAQGMEGGMGFYVRGGGNGNNRVELDGVTISAPTHLFGLFSTFHADIVDKSTFQMGGISAASGDLLSSLLKIETPKPNLERYQLSASLSPLMVGASLQGYLVKHKLSFQLAGRSALLRPEYLLAKKIAGAENVSGDFNPQVQDGYAKLFWAIHPKHSLEMMLYGSHDQLKYEPEIEDYTTSNSIHLGWDNSVAKLQWNYQPTLGTRLVTTAYSSKFTSIQEQREFTIRGLSGGMGLGSEKYERAIRSQLFTRWRSIAINGGVDVRALSFKPAMQKTYLNHYDAIVRQSDYRTSQSSLFTEAEYQDTRYKLKGGLRYTFYKDAAKHPSHHLDVRLQGSTFLTRNAGVEVTFDRLSQFQHSLEGLPVGWALDLMVPASQQLPTELSHQYYVGGFWGNDTFYATLGGYYRHLSHIATYKSLLNLFAVHNVSWEEDVAAGKGASYGLELWLEKRKGRWTGSMAYTLSRTTRQFAEINRGLRFPFKFDRTHNLNVQSQYLLKASERREQRFHTGLYFSSGHNMTIPVATYSAEDLPFWETTSSSSTHNHLYSFHANYRTQMSKVNEYRVANYLRLDVGYSVLWKRRTWQHELTFSLYNVLNRKNPYLVFHEEDRWKQLSLLSIIPSIRWELRF
jgi:hypothetical protein